MTNFISMRIFHNTAKIISIGAFLVSVSFTVIFNISQASGMLDMVLLAFLGVIQDSSEVILAIVGVMFWLRGGRLFKAISLLCFVVSISLVGWSITATWAGNNGMIESASKEAELISDKYGLLKSAIQSRSQAADQMMDNANAMSEKAKSYSKKYNWRAKKMLEESQKIANQAADSSRSIDSLLSKIDSIDTDKIAKVNSAKAAFKKISGVTDIEENKVATVFLLTRASQLELIGIIMALVALITGDTSVKDITAEVRKKKKRSKEKSAKDKSTSVKSEPTSVKKSVKKQTKVGTPSNTEVKPEFTEIQIKQMINVRDKNKQANNGDKVPCPVCSKVFTKSRGSLYCSNKGKGNCADKFKNVTDPNKAKRRVIK